MGLLVSVGIAEMSYNIPMLRSMIDICNVDDTDLTVFTTSDIFKKLDYTTNNFNIVTKNNNASLKSYLKLLSDHSYGLDCLFVNTISGSFLDYYNWSHFFKPHCFSVLTIHNVNRWFNPSLRFTPNGYPLSHLLDAHAKNMFRKDILSCFNGFNTIFPIIHHHLGKFTDKPLYSFPFMYYKKPDVVSMQKNRIRVVIPGIVTGLRRDYSFIFNVLKGLFDYNDRFEFIFLGECSSDVADKFRYLIDKGYSITFFESWVGFDVWDVFMSSADILLLPIQSIFKCVESDEFYGVSKGSGTISNAVCYGKPFLIPSGIPVGDELRDMSYTYKSVDDVINFLVMLLSGEDNVRLLSLEADDCASRFDLGFYQDMFRNNIFLKGVCSKI